VTTRPKLPDFRALREVTEVTREYAAYARTHFGLAGAAAGAWLVAAVLLKSRLGAWGWLPFAAAPAVVVWSRVVDRAYYQRHGAVVGRSWSATALGQRLGTYLVIACVASALAWEGWLAFSWAAEGGGGRWLAFTALLAGTTVAALRAVQTRPPDDSPVSFLVWMVFASTLSNADPRRSELAFPAVFSLLLGITLVASGIVQHRRYRLLEHRVAALKEVQ
jgi:hypothetical protein